ncbi:glycosyltransferase family 2 protein [Pseudotamlana carrageenivorans]|uniref:Glycosyltransferase n=1 Tax=Pseudotamlana carrageenivorans TaxID=2069432 RepID=A0A2I7SHV7_9FLAO|nr:glycosyltransferase [Tamlana carrageenivorans]AUS05454.1 glycosyltransferase [Tamlana carrageenivorans]
MMFLYTAILILYVILIGSLAYGCSQIKIFNGTIKKPATKFSVVIPFRNEAKNLPQLLASIFNLNYPKTLFEVILVDDASEDDSVKLIHNLTKDQRIDLKIIPNERNSNSPKKDAITSAISKSNHDWIITTDADCILPEFWLDSFDAFIQKTGAYCIAGPVTYHVKSSFLNRFQCLDILSLQGATIGGFGLKTPFLCNGANFAYKKSLFTEVSGFEGNTNIASGDDLFLLEKALDKQANRVNYLKCQTAIIKTNAQENWKQLISQRVRWAAKTTAYKNGFGKLTGVLVFATNLLLVIGLILSLFGLFSFKNLSITFVLKCGTDFYLLYKTARFFKQTSILKNFVVSAFLYPFFNVYVAFMALFSNYNWKGRTFKR